MKKLGRKKLLIVYKKFLPVTKLALKPMCCLPVDT